MASKFSEAGRPLSKDATGFPEWENADRGIADDHELDPFPPATKRAFWTAAFVATVILAAMTWFGPW